MNMTIRDLMHLIDEAINKYVKDCEAKGINWNINKFLNSVIVLGNDDELNGIHLCNTFDFLTDAQIDCLDDLGVEFEDDKDYVLFV
jgi:hypothetical protein